MKNIVLTVIVLSVLTACGSDGSSSNSTGTNPAPSPTPSNNHKNVVLETQLNRQFQTDILNMDSIKKESLDVENFAKTVTYLNDSFASFLVKTLNKKVENEAEKYSSFHEVIRDLPSDESSFFLEIDQYNAMLVTIVQNNPSQGRFSIIVQADYDLFEEHPAIIETLNGNVKPDLLTKNQNTAIIFLYTLDEQMQTVSSSLGFNDYAYTIYTDHSSNVYHKTKQDLSGNGITITYDLNLKTVAVKKIVNKNSSVSTFNYNELTDSIE